jgi:trk system potassium uptake protein TrkH
MDGFDAVCHAFSTVSTGGFSTHQASAAYWNSGYIETVLIVFMILGATNFPLMYFLFVKGDVKKFFRDEELRWFLAVIALATLSIAAALIIDKDYAWLTAFRQSIFHVVALITTTGFTTVDFSGWGPFFLLVFLFVMIVCGCSGSTSGGLKTARGMVLMKNTVCEFERLAHPRAIIPVRVNRQALSFGTVQRLLAFAFLYLAIILVSWLVLSLTGLSFIDAMSASVTAISNVGPGFGMLFDSFAEASDFTKWYLAFLMLVGRLEIFPILILLTPGFWKR